MRFPVLAAVAAFAIVAAGPVVACEMHQSHAAMTTAAAAEPAPPPKAEKPAAAAEVVLPMSKPAERPMQSMSSGYSGCARNSESALLTN